MKKVGVWGTTKNVSACFKCRKVGNIVNHIVRVQKHEKGASTNTFLILMYNEC